jgi:hypothetical protein
MHTDSRESEKRTSSVAGGKRKSLHLHTHGDDALRAFVAQRFEALEKSGDEKRAMARLRETFDRILADYLLRVTEAAKGIVRASDMKRDRAVAFLEEILGQLGPDTAALANPEMRELYENFVPEIRKACLGVEPDTLARVVVELEEIVYRRISEGSKWLVRNSIVK